MIAAGPITNLQSHFLFFVELYYNLFIAFSSDPNSNEVALAAIFYTFIICTLPLTFGLFPRDIRLFKSRTAPTMTTILPISYGGSLYKLFASDRKYKSYLGMSKRGSDCFILFD
ncbi:hypothetical protein THRCLA_20674 [Thraustotheca clavata]|uniref:Uncharacterized protein n=1 Tax=Thraustotheca clavata TaxID=74557 RepID=A0A1W0A4U7_9STRA|nr:hypothetical protein THRCLA_20674 [Thraustotheca clavata]